MNLITKLDAIVEYKKKNNEFVIIYSFIHHILEKPFLFDKNYSFMHIF